MRDAKRAVERGDAERLDARSVLAQARARPDPTCLRTQAALASALSALSDERENEVCMLPLLASPLGADRAALASAPPRHSAT